MVGIPAPTSFTMHFVGHKGKDDMKIPAYLEKYYVDGVDLEVPEEEKLVISEVAVTRSGTVMRR